MARRTTVKPLSAFVILGMFLGVMGGGQAIAAESSTPLMPSYTVIMNQLGDVDGFGFGREVCPIGCELPEPPLGSDDPQPFDAPDSPCALSQSWTHDFGADLPEGAQIISAALVVNVAGIQPDIFASVLAADTRVMPLTPFAQGALGSGLVPVPLTPGDLADGLLRVSIQKGIRTRSSTICDDQFYDASVLIMLVKLP
jgi:hypothetical protein